MRNKANLYPEPTSKIFGLNSVTGSRPKSAAISGKKLGIRYNRLPPQLVTPFDGSSAKFLQKDKQKQTDDLMQKLATKSRQGAISRQGAAQAIGHPMNQATTL